MITTPKLKIVYLHGLESNSLPQNPKIIWLRKQPHHLYAPQVDWKDPRVLHTLYSQIHTTKPHLIIGSSAGGAAAYTIGNLTGTRTLLYNPAVLSTPPQFPFPPTQTHHTIWSGLHDTIIPQHHLRNWAQHQTQPYKIYSYLGGHRVPLDTFQESITLLLNQITHSGLL